MKKIAIAIFTRLLSEQRLDWQKIFKKITISIPKRFSVFVKIFAQTQNSERTPLVVLSNVFTPTRKTLDF